MNTLQIKNHTTIQTNKVLLVYGKYKCKIEGLGTIDVSISGHRIKYINVIYVLTLECTPFIIKSHIQLTGFTQHAYNNQFILALLAFLSDATFIYGITITIKKAVNYHQIQFDEITPKRHDRPSNKKSISVKNESKPYEAHVTATYYTIIMWIYSLHKQHHNWLDPISNLSAQHPFHPTLEWMYILTCPWKSFHAYMVRLHQ